MLPPDAPLLRSLIFVAGLAIFLALELLIPYRPNTVSKSRRWAVNLGLTAFNSLAMFLIMGTAILAVARLASQGGIGFLNMLEAPYWVKFLAGLVFLDFMLYVWHLLNHVVPLLWRFHRVHHTDLNMDVSTATRFHLGELLPSAFIKMGLLYLSGADPLLVIAFESLLVLCAQFHHSSLRVPAGFERLWWVFFVPPSMHRIHHSVKIKERNTNYGTIFSLWDRLMGTMLAEVDQAGIKIGVGGHFDPAKLRLPGLLMMPLTRQVR